MAIVEFELTDKELATIGATLGTCILMGLERHIKPHRVVARRIRAVEDSLQNLAQLAGCKLDRVLVDAGIVAWGAAVEKLAEELHARGEDGSTGHPASSVGTRKDF